MKQFIAILFLLATAVGLMADETDRAVYRLNVQPFVELTVVDGMASKARLSNVGTGSVDARDLMAENINCFVFSTGSIDCSPSGRLRIYGAGSGKVFYHVEPEKITNRGIGVKVHSAVENKEDNTASDK